LLVNDSLTRSYARNNRTSVARGVFYVVRIYPLLGNGPINTFPLRQILGKEPIAR
jgi:hypothetical protein